MSIHRLQIAFVTLIVVAAGSLLIMGWGLYQQNQDIKALQSDQADQTDYLCRRLASLAERISTRTNPIRTLLRIEASEADGRGETLLAKRLRAYTDEVLVPQNVEC